MGFIQRVEEKLFRLWKAIDKTRPGSLQDVHLIRTASQASITLSVCKERLRLAKEAEKQEQREKKTRFKETCKLVEDIFEWSIGLNECQGIAKEAREGNDLTGVKSSHREIEGGCLNADDWGWDKVEWDGEEWDGEKQSEEK
ncbi:uncharacterized protein EAF01_006131 [Botrytis porri]|uniref:Uncharacterized protein n=1 Tax=Botrytis porri TaxID=87229 RepID=A0A4Z1L321_9HELO|nr:uncharacterized protein EAF01_006131 [Botrytis porri]KAF7905610.1 hypothetical protein EAF01_006131 [Botrytis porri]TGO91169.1 hypothetical protein BPOR_0037g00320 [Botrytis porri]